MIENILLLTDATQRIQNDIIMAEWICSKHQ